MASQAASHKKNPQSTFVMAAGLTMILASMLILYFVFRPRPKLDEEATDILTGLFQGDGNALHGHFLDEELQSVNLNETQADLIVSRYVVPHLRAVKLVKVDRSFTQGGGQGSTSLFVRLPSGKMGTVGLLISRSTKKDIVPLTQLIEMVWRLDEMVITDNPTPELVTAWTHGEMRDREVLKGMGLKGLASNDLKFVDWDHIEARGKKLNADREAYLNGLANKGGG